MQIKNVIEKFKKHWIMYILLVPVVAFALLILYVVVVLGVITYIDSHQFDNSEKNLPKPLSTQGLPPPATDVPVVLPPDPGEAGKATLEGIDSNHDGVRDDLEREIVYMYPQNEEVRRVLRAMVKKMQDTITTTGDHDHFEALAVSELAFWNCYDYLVFGPRLTGYNAVNITKLWNMVQNTPERKKMFEVNDQKARPYSGNVDYKSEHCNQPLIKGQY